MFPNQHPYPFLNVKLPLQSSDIKGTERKERTAQNEQMKHFSLIMDTGSKWLSCPCVHTVHPAVAVLKSKAAALWVLSPLLKGLDEHLETWGLLFISLLRAAEELLFLNGFLDYVTRHLARVSLKYVTVSAVYFMFFAAYF